MSKIPLISVIIPTYNRGNTIECAIESVLSQTLTDYEVIVVDDGSSDNTKIILNNYSGKIRYIYQDNGGPSKARNTGIKAAKGEWIAFLDSDDFWINKKLEIQYSETIKHNCYACFHDVIFRYDERGLDIKKKSEYNNLYINSNFKNIRTLVLKDAYKLLMESQYIFLTSTILIKANIINIIGGFLESLRSSEDYELYYRIAAKYNISYINEKLGIYNNDPARRYNIEKIYEDRIQAIKISLCERELKNDFVLQTHAKNGILHQLRCLAGYYRRTKQKKKALAIYNKMMKYYFGYNSEI